MERGYSVTEDRVKRTEALFWGKYKVLKKKYEWAKEIYQKTGKVFMMFGHERRGFLTYNQICNSYIQGPAFHCLLDSFCEINDTRKREGWNTMLRGQIHDAIILDIHPSEEAHVIHTVTSIMTAGMQKRHKEIIVPLLAEWELCKVDEPWPMKKGIPTPVA